MSERVVFGHNTDPYRAVPVATALLPDGRQVTITVGPRGVHVLLYPSPDEVHPFASGPIATRWTDFADMTAHLTIERKS